jgi:hypothetical protein
MSNQSSEINHRSSVVSHQSSITRFFAYFFSYIFHPLFIPLYVTWFLAFVHPGYFSGIGRHDKVHTLILVAYIMIFFPLVTVFLLKQLDFIKSFFLHTQQDRIIPYIACGIYFFWMYIVFHNDENMPKILTGFILGVFLSSSAALIANIYYKISMHAIGVGGLLGVFLVVMWQNTMLMTWPLSLAFLITGITCTSRLIISDHKPKEIYMGLLVGLIFQFIAAFVVV